MSRSLALLAGTTSAAALGYLGYVAVTWYRFGRTGSGCASDPLLDRFLPSYEVRECHQKSVRAPAALTLAAAKEISLRRSPLARAVFAIRSIPSRLGGTPHRIDERGILQETLSLGWGVLAETPGREIVMGAVTQPWKAEVVFRALPPEKFAAFAEPGYVKIAWTLRADPTGPSSCMFRVSSRPMPSHARASAAIGRSSRLESCSSATRCSGWSRWRQSACTTRRSGVEPGHG